MLNGVIRFALANRPLILALSAVVLLYGGYAAATLPIDVFPDLDRPRVTVLVESHGMAAEEVETQVTFPLESALLGANGVQDVRSQSGPGLAVISVEFDWATDIRSARQVVKERLDAAAPALPPGCTPQLAPISSIMGQIMVVGMHRRRSAGEAPAGGDDLALRTLADWVVRPRLLKISGVAQVVILGGGRKQYQVVVDPAALTEYGVTLEDVESALRRGNLNASGGFSEAGDAEIPIRVLARLGPRPEDVVADLKKIPVKASVQRPVLLEQVARIGEGAEPKRGDASVNGLPGVVLTITKQPHVDTRSLTDEVEAALAQLRPSLPADVAVDTDLFQLRGFIDRGIFNVAEALAIGAGLVVAVLFVFLLNFRTTFISLTAIPLSLALTAIVFKLVGRFTGVTLTINVMTLGGLAVAMGELVDDAIVDVENIFRRLRENAARGEPRSALAVIYSASVEVRSAIVFGTAVVILVFLPLFALSGVEGRLFTPLGVAYIVSILASLAVSLTVTPVLSYYLLAGSRVAAGRGDGAVVRGLKWLAGHLVRLSLRFAGLLLALTWLFVLAGGWALTRLGADFLPQFDEGVVQINMSLPAGASVAASNRAAEAVDAKLRSLQATPERPRGDVLQFVRRTGRAELDEHADPPNATEYLVTVNPVAGRSRDEVIGQLLAELQDGLPGIDFEAEQPLAHLISHMISGVQAQIAIKLYGDDLDVLRRTAERIRAVAAGVPGTSRPVIESLRQVEELHIRLRPDDLAQFGLDRSAAAQFVQTAVQGAVVTQVVEGQRRFDLLVRFDEAARADAGVLSRLRLERPGGGAVLLGEVADVGPGLGANQVKRDNARRRIVIRCNALGRDLRGVVGDIREQVQKSVTLPEGYYVEFGGQFESQRRATLLIAVLAVVAGFGMFVVVLMLFPSVRVALQILNAIPAAFIGGVAALVLTGQTLTVASMVGFISLGGIATRNGILLVTHYFHLMRHEGERFTPEMILRGSLERLSPVLMTALTAGIGLIPLVVGGRQPGREILYPVATVILGGLVTSTLCEFLLHPGLFWRFSGTDAERLTRLEAADAV